MSRPSEYWSEELAHSSGKPDANLAANALQLGGIDAEDFATKKYVQEYHKAKELLLKDYIDAQDLAKLQEAKDYVDTMIRNQDFSSFSKLTDLQALSQNLTERIESCRTECENNINNRISAVVQDVNENFSDVNSAITQLNANDERLFQSVSNGKQALADAITDKGIHTSATDSYSTMAQNIRNIETSGGGDYDENYVNTSDGNAAANDIALGKIAYAKGQKIFGTHEDLDTADATATENDIRLGKTAYVNGEKKIGTLNASEYPTYGTDTSNATATSADIIYGKTAYARGQLITGTLDPASVAGIEEIYETSVDDYKVKENAVGLTLYPDTSDEVKYRYCMEFSKDNNYCVSGVLLNDPDATDTSSITDFCIESHQIGEDGLIVSASTGISGDTIYKKYRYTKLELGIGEGEKLLEIRLGSPGLLGNSGMCLLMIRTDTYLHFYSYHLSDNGVIGKCFDTENYIINNFKDSYESGEKANLYWSNSIFANTNPYKLFAVGSIAGTYHGLKYQEIELIPTINNSELVVNIYKSDVRFVGLNSSNTIIRANKLKISPNDKYISDWEVNLGVTSYPTAIIIELDEFLKFKSLTATNLYRASLAIETLGKKILGYVNEEKSFIFDNKTIYLLDSNRNGSLEDIIVTPNEDKIIALTGGKSSNNLKVNIFNTEDILNASDNEIIQPIKTFNLSNNDTTQSYFLKSNSDGTNIKIFGNSFSRASTSGGFVNTYKVQMWTLSSVANTENLVAVKYRNQLFRSVKSGILSATKTDVLSGKTFIGYDGSVQTGTLANSTE